MGSQSGAHRSLRLVGVKNEDTGRYHLYVTNIPPERLMAEQVARVYAGRRQIDMSFKEMKSRYRLEDLTSRKPHIVEALLYATLVTLVISRRLLRAVRQVLHGWPHAVPEGRWAAIAPVLSAILDLLLAPARLARHLARWTGGHAAPRGRRSQPGPTIAPRARRE